MSFQDTHALVIGISAYRRVRPLPPVQDAQDVAAALAIRLCAATRPPTHGCCSRRRSRAL
jgi:uncharacterized ParB-like nuclease family protein